MSPSIFSGQCHHRFLEGSSSKLLKAMPRQQRSPKPGKGMERALRSLASTLSSPSKKRASKRGSGLTRGHVLGRGGSFRSAATSSHSAHGSRGSGIRIGYSGFDEHQANNIVSLVSLTSHIINISTHPMLCHVIGVDHSEACCNCRNVP